MSARPRAASNTTGALAAGNHDLHQSMMRATAGLGHAARYPAMPGGAMRSTAAGPYHLYPGRPFRATAAPSAYAPGSPYGFERTAAAGPSPYGFERTAAAGPSPYGFERTAAPYGAPYGFERTAAGPYGAPYGFERTAAGPYGAPYGFEPTGAYPAYQGYRPTNGYLGKMINVEPSESIPDLGYKALKYGTLAGVAGAALYTADEGASFAFSKANGKSYP